MSHLVDPIVPLVDLFPYKCVFPNSFLLSFCPNRWIFTKLHLDSCPVHFLNTTVFRRLTVLKEKGRTPPRLLRSKCRLRVSLLLCSSYLSPHDYLPLVLHVTPFSLTEGSSHIHTYGNTTSKVRPPTFEFTDDPRPSVPFGGLDQNPESFPSVSLLPSMLETLHIINRFTSPVDYGTGLLVGPVWTRNV